MAIVAEGCHVISRLCTDLCYIK